MQTFGTDEGTGQEQECEMNIRPPFVAHPQTPEAIQPGKGALDDPTMPSQLLAALYPTPRNARKDGAPVQ